MNLSWEQEELSNIPFAVFRGAEAAINTIRFTKDQSQFLAASDDTNTTLWDGVACPNAMENQAHFDQKGSSVTLDRVIEPTDSYTVEFWFRFPEDVSLAATQDITYLFTLSEGT